MPQTNKIKWHRDPAEAVSLYSDTDPTYSFMSDSMGRVYSVRDILNRYSNSPGKQVKDRMESRLRLLMGHPFWDAEDGSRVSPNEVLENPENENYKKHRERIDNADLSYPIMLRLKRNSEPPDVIDGVHRIAKYFKNKEQGESRPLSFRNVTAKEIQTALLASPGDKKGSHITTDVLNHLREQQRLQNLDKDAALLIGGIITKERPMESLQTNPYSPTAWEFISSQLGTKSAVQEKDAGWGDWLGYKGRDGDLIPDWLVGSGGMLYDSDYDAAGNLAGIFGTAGSLAGTTGGAALGSAVGPAGTVAGGAGGSAAGGMAGRGLGSALGNSWLGKGLNSITGSGSQNKEKLDPATWKQVVVDTAFGGVLPGAGMALNAGRAAASKGAARKILLNNMAKGKPSDAVTRRVDRLLTAFPKWNQRAGLVTKKLYPNQLLGYGTAGQAAKGIAGKSARSLAASAPATLAVGAGLRGLSGLSGSPSPNGLLGGQEFANRKTNPFSDPMTTPGVTNVVSGDATYRS